MNSCVHEETVWSSVNALEESNVLNESFNRTEGNRQSEKTNLQERTSSFNALKQDPESFETQNEIPIGQNDVVEEYLDDFYDGRDDDRIKEEILNPGSAQKDIKILLETKKFKTPSEGIRKSARKQKISTPPTFKPPKKIRKNPPVPIVHVEITDEEIDVLKVHTEIKCEKCQQICDNWLEIREHYRLKHKLRGYVRCCGRKIDRTGELKDHISWHINPHIFQCHVCGKSSISRENLRLHEKMHIADEDRHYSCPKCDKKFVHRYTIRMHMNIVHDKDGKEPTLPCTFCNKLYRTERQLKDHIKFCHMESKFICHICSKVLKTKSNLEIHVKGKIIKKNQFDF